MKKERGIAFTTEMVQAERAGLKTETRRLTGLKTVNTAPDYWVFSHFRPTTRDTIEAVFQHATDASMVCIVPSLYGKIGDLLYVKESLWIDNNYCPGLNWPTTFHVWKADEEDWSEYERHMLKSDMVQFVAGRFMYKEMARTWLEVVDIRVERLQDITHEQALAEGVNAIWYELGSVWRYRNYLPSGATVSSPVTSYLTLFQTINPKAPPNPWVWVIKFKRVTHAPQ